MADKVGYFEILNPERCEYLPFTAKSSDELANGFLAKINSDGTLSVAGVSDAPDGFAYTNRTLVYAPTTIYAQTGEPVTLVRGLVEYLADAGYFASGTLPSFGAAIYAAANGQMGLSGSATTVIGKCLSTEVDVRQPPTTVLGVVQCEARFGAK